MSSNCRTDGHIKALGSETICTIQVHRTKSVSISKAYGPGPQKSLPGRLEESAVLSARQRTYLGTTRLRGTIEKMTGIKISYGAIFQILRAADIYLKRNQRRVRDVHG